MTELTKEQLDFYKSCEEEFKDRYTEKDDDFMKIKEIESKNPPIIDPWNDRSRSNDWSRGRRQNWQRRDFNRDRDNYRSRERDRGNQGEYAHRHHQGYRRY